MSDIRLHLVCCLVLLIQAASYSRADETYLQPETVYEGDITELVIEYDNSIPSLYALDASALENDFEIVDKKSRIFRIGDASSLGHRMQWRLHLLPRKSGRLSLPPLYFGDRSTPPLTLEVLPVPPALQSSQHVFAELEVDTMAPYVGQQTRLAMRLYHNTPVHNIQLLEPQIGDALIYRQPDQQSYRVTRDGKRLDVLQHTIVIFPRNAGKQQLPAVGFRGSIGLPADTSQVNPELSVRDILRLSKPLNLKVRKPPVEFSGRYWLPASHLELTQSWNQSGKTLRVGDSIDWNLTIVARGLPAESLPADLLAMNSEKFSIYADQASRSNRFDHGQLVGSLQQRFVVIVNQPGRISLPALSLKWWNVVSNSEQQVRLESRAIDVVDVIKPEPGNPDMDAGSIKWWLNHGYQQWLGWPTLLVLLLLPVFVTALRRLHSRITPMLRLALYRQRLRQRLKRACLSNDAARARVALLEWGKERWPGSLISGLKQVDRQIQRSELSTQLQYLDAALYSRQGGDWHGRALWEQVKALKHPARAYQRAPDNELPRLYPAGS